MIAPCRPGMHVSLYVLELICVSWTFPGTLGAGHSAAHVKLRIRWRSQHPPLAAVTPNQARELPGQLAHVTMSPTFCENDSWYPAPSTYHDSTPVARR